jgi:hypothetical protein
MADDSFRCAWCGQTFLKKWDDHDAELEYAENFPDHQDAETSVVCDDCYITLMTIHSLGR